MKKRKIKTSKKNNTFLKEENELFYSNKLNNSQKKIIKRKKPNTKQFYYFFIILFIILIIFLITKFLFKIIGIKKIQEEKVIPKLSLDSIKILERDEALDSVLPFVKKCVEGIFINNIKFERAENPIISAVIPCYNCGQYLLTSLRSIQNQNMTNIEIIIVNDYSGTETVNIINKLKKEDPRIEVYNNEENMGLLYSRSFGVMKARGKYIVTVDADDNLCDSDVFDSLYIAAEDGNFDIISYRIFEAHDYYDRHRIDEHVLNFKAHNLTVYQPELSCYARGNNANPRVNDINIWGKLIRTSVYKEAINLIGKERLLNKVTCEEDSIAVFVLGVVASSYRYIRKYCYYHYGRKVSASSTLTENGKAIGILTKIDVELDYSKKECSNIPAISLINNSRNLLNANDDKCKNMLKKVVKRIMDSNVIDEKYKNDIKNIYSSYLPNI